MKVCGGQESLRPSGRPAVRPFLLRPARGTKVGGSAAPPTAGTGTKGITPRWVHSGAGAIWRALLSRRLAIVVLALVSLVLVLGTLLPDASQMTEGQLLWLAQERPATLWLAGFLQIQKATRSTPFLLLIAWLMVSTAVCTWTRVRGRLRRRDTVAAIRRPFTGESRFWVERERDAVRQDALSLLGGRRYRIASEDTRAGLRITAAKGRLGFWGSALFHASLVVVFAGALFSGLTRFSGYVLLTEGQTMVLDESGFIRTPDRPRVGGSFPPTPVSLRHLTPEYRDDRYLVGLNADVEVGEGRSLPVRESLGVNRPMTYMGFQFHLERIGFAPAFLIRDAGGRVLLDAYINLVVLREDQEDSFRVPGTDLVVRARLYPDFHRHLGFPATRSPIPRNPVLDLVVLDRGRSIYSGLAPLSQPIRLAEYTLTFQDLRYWGYFGVTRDWGAPAVTAGLFLAVLGLLVRVSFYEKTVCVEVRRNKSGCEVALHGRSRYFPAFLEEELGRMREALERRAFGHSAVRPFGRSEPGRSSEHPGFRTREGLPVLREEEAAWPVEARWT